MWARWGVAIGGSVAAFALAWWICSGVLHVDEGVTFGVAGAALAIVLGFLYWWAPRVADRGKVTDGGDVGGGYRVQQNIRGKNVNVAGRDQTIINNRRGDD
jgi:hypothetical protein